MTIPLDNLYDYIFSLTGHTNKNLIMYRFEPYGSKNIKDLIVHNNLDDIYGYDDKKEKLFSYHYKLLFCYDQEPLNFDLYMSKHFDESRKNIFEKIEGQKNKFNNSLGKKLIRKMNIAGHPSVPVSVYDKSVLLHSEKNSEDLKKYEQNDFIGAYYWSHAFIALDWYRFADHDKSLKFISDIQFKKDFNVYCRAWTGTREYRLKFLELLNKNNIDKKSNIFFNENCDSEHYSTYPINEKQWEVDIKNIDNLTCCIPRNVDSSASATYESDDYQTSAIDVVLETVFNKNKIQLTEKILRPIACGKPFILVSDKESLKYLKSYGFKTFEYLIDESYDLIENSKDRLYAIVETMKKISNLPKKEKNQLFFEMHKIAEYNKKWFFSERFFDIINSELEDNLTCALDMLDHPCYQTGKNLKLEYRTYRRYQKHLSGESKKFADMIIEEYPARIELSKRNIGIS